MILLDIAAPIFLMIGISLSNSGTAALLGNFEIVATSIIAMIIFHESIGRRLWIAIALISVASILLSFEQASSATMSFGAIFVLLACVCWGFENNCTRSLSIKDPLQIVILKGFGSGAGALLIAVIWSQITLDWFYIGAALLLGFVAYGLSIFFYVKAQRTLGAARTSTYYAAAPFIGVLISWLLLKELITLPFLAALVIMLIGTYFAVSEKHQHLHRHLQETHEHKHSHADGHHTHKHDAAQDHINHNQETEQVEAGFEHSHPHTHDGTEHEHAHLPDVHHRHRH
jgi:drug/metabolite transporter (DMT)-like permease